MNQSVSLVSIVQKPINKQIAVAKQLIILTLEMLLSFPLALVLTKLHFGGISWIFGGIFAGTAILQTCRIFYQYSPRPNRMARRVGMALVGLTVGAANANTDLTEIVTGIPIFIFLTLFLLLCGGCIGYIYSRLSQTNLLTAMLATVPGGVGVMSAIAADYNKNVTLVALVQAIRVTSVVLLIPCIARTAVGNYWNLPNLSINNSWWNFDPSQIGLLAIALPITALIVYLVTKCKLPAGDFFGALILGLTFNTVLDLLPLVSDIQFDPPRLVNIIGQLLLGITIGEYWGEKPTLGKKTLGYALMSVVMTLIAGAIATIIAMQITSWDWLTCLLVTAPGGAAEMILVSLALDHNVEIVTTGHLVRLIAINSSLPLWLFLFRRFEECKGVRV
ncbi:AbrB family transcriptional regulator [Nostoc sp. CMAA1605]|uniref:AbrB family transcriptional regulator n=1 Tax=Nostoc sp. CMAA1605 TaxID=2055159 RepID=UPI001F39FD54|nr:AbrB family transcriptional regulator [Nostoc sp. CMAA1605]MCF4967428.1 AbrB family transcriptional regulator [Nostoc sp. CMAA1605]